MTILQLAQWVWEGYNWCVANASACGPVVNSGMCEVEDYACSGPLDNAAVHIQTGVDDNLSWMEGGGEHSLLYDLGDGYPGYDTPYGWGSWGVMDELPDNGALCFKLGDC